METGVLSPLATVSPATETISPTASTSSSTAAADHSHTLPLSVANPHIIHTAQITRTPTYEATGFPPTLFPTTPFQDSSATSSPWSWVNPVPMSTQPHQSPTPNLPPMQEAKPMFINPLNGQRWYSDTPLEDQSQAPRFLASNLHSTPTPRFSAQTNTQYTSQHTPLPSHFPSTLRHFIPAQSIGVSHTSGANMYATPSTRSASCATSCIPTTRASVHPTRPSSHAHRA
ncbi:hypothetical protein BKA65DRAFT_513052 [Rhexocercosporidium sp. MPI-PUGE-AT-0058]|nr:hypothetical protein BKA65DRAFT_513052 [Rhexocercosporidium sp. MPI-PUGE-AT-0058]